MDMYLHDGEWIPGDDPELKGRSLYPRQVCGGLGLVSREDERVDGHVHMITCPKCRGEKVIYERLEKRR